jgi:hypothetical protein
LTQCTVIAISLFLYIIDIIGIKRLDRWEWAKRHGLEPPENVKQLIKENSNDSDFEERFVFQTYLEFYSIYSRFLIIFQSLWYRYRAML